MKPCKKFSINRETFPKGIDSSFIKFCEVLSSSVEVRDFLLNLQAQIPKKFKTGELILFYESEQLGLRRAYIKNNIFYEPSAQEFWPVIEDIRLSSVEENLYLAKEFGRPFFKALMVPLNVFPLKALLVLEISNQLFLKPLRDFFEKRRAILELSFKKSHLNTHFSRISYLWSQLFFYWQEPLAILNDFQVLLGNDSFKKNLSLSTTCLKDKINSGLLEQGEKVYQLHYYPLKKSQGVLYCQDRTKSFILKEQLFQTEKMSRLFGLGQNMAHQLNNPLTGVKAMTQILKTNPILEGFNEEFEELEKAVQRSQKIIKSFLSFSNQKEQRKSCDIHQVLDDTLPLLKKALKGIKLETYFCKQNLEVKGDFSLLQQVFYNLILNACEALSEEEKNETPMIQISACLISENELCLKIKDNGVGIEQEKLDKIFQPFWTSKKKGTGLGLGVAKKIIQQFNGKLFISSQKNQFTCFTLIFPLSSRECPPVISSEPTACL